MKSILSLAVVALVLGFAAPQAAEAHDRYSSYRYRDCAPPRSYHKHHHHRGYHRPVYRSNRSYCPPPRHRYYSDRYHSHRRSGFSITFTR